MFDQRGKAVKVLKTNYYKSLLVTNFVPTCSFISLYNGMYTVCVMIHLSEQAILIELHLQVIVKVMDNIPIYKKKMKYCRPEFYANVTLLTFYKNVGRKTYPYFLNPKILELICSISK